jgi:hypothetical protein
MMHPRAALPALLFAILAGAQEPTLPQRVRDDFATDSRDNYRIEGDVTWHKGRLTLGPGAAISRKLGLGETVEIELAVSFPEENARAELRLSLGEKAKGPLLALRREGEKVTLTDRTDRAGPSAAVGKAPPSNWRLRVHLGWGLLRARAWPDGDAEPDAWAVTRFRQSLYEAAAASARVEAAGAGVALRSFHARGTAHLTPTGPQRTLLQRAGQRNLEA